MTGVQTCALPIFSILPYVGSKRTDLKYFIKDLPKHVTKIVEPFGGSGYVSLAFFAENRNIKCHINDIDEELINFFTQTKKYPQKILAGYNSLIENITKRSFRKVIEKYKSGKGTKPQRAVLFLFFHRVHGIRMGLYPKGKSFLPLTMEDYPEFFSWIKVTKFTCKDYQYVFNKYKNIKSAFMFVDPPYLDSFNAYYSSYGSQTKKLDDDKVIQDNTQVFVDIVDFFNSAKCKIMLIINKNAITSRLYEKYIVDEYDKIYQMTKKKTKHLVICNY